MRSGGSSTPRLIVIWSMRIILGLIFLWIGANKLAGTGNTVEYFAAIGWGQWLRYMTGLFDIVGVTLLFVPTWGRLGAVVLTCSVGLGALLSVTVLRGNPTWGSGAMAAVPLALTVLAAALAWLTRGWPLLRSR